MWFDLPYAVVMARTIRRTVRRAVTRQELWNGNREPWSNLFSWNPEKSIIAWAATRHRSTVSATGTPSTTRAGPVCDFVRLRSQREADAFLDGVTITAPNKE